MTDNATGKQRIDVHHHFWAPDYLRELRELSIRHVPFDWTPDKSIADMDAGGVATSVLSVTTPGIWWGNDEQGRRLARSCNEYAARLVEEYKGRFGMFATIPLPDIEGSLLELEYAIDVLKADGIALLTSYENRWLGDPAFDPVFAELNRRAIVVYTHPTDPACCRNLLPGVNESVIEYATDTTRAIARMLFSGAAHRFHDVRFIWSHSGGTMPFLLERLTRLGASPAMAPLVPDGVLAELQRFFYDVAQAAHPLALSALTKLVPASKILFGTDFPYRNASEYPPMLEEFGFGKEDMLAIERENALTLLPRLRVPNSTGT